MEISELEFKAMSIFASIANEFANRKGLQTIKEAETNNEEPRVEIKYKPLEMSSPHHDLSITLKFKDENIAGVKFIDGKITNIKDYNNKHLCLTQRFLDELYLNSKK